MFKFLGTLGCAGLFAFCLVLAGCPEQAGFEAAKNSANYAESVKRTKSTAAQKYPRALRDLYALFAKRPGTPKGKGFEQGLERNANG
jgi:Flp pilus assembly protein TadD